VTWTGPDAAPEPTRDPAPADRSAERARDAEQALTQLYPRVLEIEDLLRESRADLADLRSRLVAAEATAAELEADLERTRARLAEETDARRLAEHHVELLLHTRVMRVLARPRAAYGSYLGRRRPEG
jgi:hypothetical protein